MSARLHNFPFFRDLVSGDLRYYLDMGCYDEQDIDGLGLFPFKTRFPDSERRRIEQLFYDRFADRRIAFYEDEANIFWRRLRGKIGELEQRYIPLLKSLNAFNNPFLNKIMLSKQELSNINAREEYRTHNAQGTANQETRNAEMLENARFNQGALTQSDINTNERFGYELAQADRHNQGGRQEDMSGAEENTQEAYAYARGQSDREKVGGGQTVKEGSGIKSNESFAYNEGQSDKSSVGGGQSVYKDAEKGSSQEFHENWDKAREKTQRETFTTDTPQNQQNANLGEFKDWGEKSGAADDINLANFNEGFITSRDVERNHNYSQNVGKKEDQHKDAREKGGQKADQNYSADKTAEAGKNHEHGRAADESQENTARTEYDAEKTADSSKNNSHERGALERAERRAAQEYGSEKSADSRKEHGHERGATELTKKDTGSAFEAEQASRQMAGLQNFRNYADDLWKNSSEHKMVQAADNRGLDGRTLSSVVLEWRETFIRADEQFLNECEQLFMGVLL